MKYLLFIVAILAVATSCTKEMDSSIPSVNKFPLYDEFDASNHILVHSSTINGIFAGVAIKGRFSLGTKELQKIDKFSINDELLTPDSRNRYLHTYSRANTDIQKVKNSFLGKYIRISLSNKGKEIVETKMFNPSPLNTSFNQDLRHVSRKKPLTIQWTTSNVSSREDNMIGVYIAQRGTTDLNDDSVSKISHVDYFEDNGTYQVPMDILDQYPVNSKVDILFARGTQLPVDVDGQTYYIGVNVVSTDLFKLVIDE